MFTIFAVSLAAFLVAAFFVCFVYCFTYTFLTGFLKKSWVFTKLQQDLSIVIAQHQTSLVHI